MEYEETALESYETRDEERDEKLLYDPVDAAMLSLALREAETSGVHRLQCAEKRRGSAAVVAGGHQHTTALLSADRFVGQPYIGKLRELGVQSWDFKVGRLSLEALAARVQEDDRPEDGIFVNRWLSRFSTEPGETWIKLPEMTAEEKLLGKGVVFLNRPLRHIEFCDY